MLNATDSPSLLFYHLYTALFKWNNVFFWFVSHRSDLVMMKRPHEGLLLISLLISVITAHLKKKNRIGLKDRIYEQLRALRIKEDTLINTLV